MSMEEHMESDKLVKLVLKIKYLIARGPNVSAVRCLLLKKKQQMFWMRLLDC